MSKPNQEQRIARLETQLAQLGAVHNTFVDTVARQIDRLSEQLAESNLRLLFTMRWFKFAEQRASGLLDVTGRSQTVATEATLDQLFHRMRGAFEETLRYEYEQQQQKAAAAAAAVDASAGAGEGAAGDADSDGATTDQAARATRAPNVAPPEAGSPTGPRRLH